MQKKYRNKNSTVIKIIKIISSNTFSRKHVLVWSLYSIGIPIFWKENHKVKNEVNGVIKTVNSLPYYYPAEYYR